MTSFAFDDPSCMSRKKDWNEHGRHLDLPINLCNLRFLTRLFPVGGEKGWERITTSYSKFNFENFRRSSIYILCFVRAPIPQRQF